jgi:hypothetical protein
MRITRRKVIYTLNKMLLYIITELHNLKQKLNYSSVDVLYFKVEEALHFVSV